MAGSAFQGHEENGCLAYRPAGQCTREDVQKISGANFRTRVLSRKGILKEETEAARAQLHLALISCAAT